jgi:alpha-mannosidase
VIGAGLRFICVDEAGIEMPAEWSGKQIMGRFNFGKTGNGYNEGFESLLYVEGEQYQGVDTNHQEVFFDNKYAGKELLLQFRLWSGLTGMSGTRDPLEHQVRRVELCWLDEATDDLFFTSKAVLQTLEVLPDGHSDKEGLMIALDRSFLALDWAEPGSDEFYESAIQAQEILKSEISQMEKRHSVTLHCIGHTHIDVAWLWRLRHTREKAARSFSTVLQLIEKYPEYLFMQSQPMAA